MAGIRIFDSDFPRDCHDPVPRVTSKQREMHNRQDGTSARTRSGEVVKRLLPNSKRKTHWVRHGDFSPVIGDIPVQCTRIGHEKFTLGVVVRVITHPSRHYERTLDAPSRSCTEVEIGRLEAAPGRWRTAWFARATSVDLRRG